MFNKILYILLSFILIAPYKQLGQDNMNGIFIGAIAIFFIFSTKKIEVNKQYTVASLIMIVATIISLVNTSLTVDSLQGLSLYVSGTILFVILSQYKDKEKSIIKIITYVIAASAVFYIVYQGAILKGGILESRIDGNVGYANSYALLMIIGIYLNKIREKDSFKEMLDIAFIIGVFFTGSRSTLLYLGIFIVLDIIMNRKEEKKLNLTFLFNVCISVVMYILIEKIGMAIVLILPIIFIVYYYLINDKNMKVVNILTIISLPIGGISLLLSSSNVMSRLLSMSFKSNELQLRIGYLKDVFSYIKSNPLGGGINTYVYNQGSFQSGPYDVRYVHNSFGQALYDMGWIGLIAFIIIFVIGIIVILKGKNERKIYYLGLYLSIYMHSLLDFDFAYLFTFMIIALIVAFCGNSNIQSKINIKALSIPIVIVGVYIMTISSIAYLGEYNFNKCNYNSTVSLGKALDKITVGKDNYGEELLFKGYIGLAASDNYTENINKAIDVLKNKERSNHRTTHIYFNLALAYGELGDVEKAEYYYEKLLELQKYNYSMYVSYSNIYGNEEKKNEIMKRYEEVNNERSRESKEIFK